MGKNYDRQPRAEQLQFLRFGAFLLIFLLHCDEYQIGLYPADNGAVSAVCFFIMLSGFTSALTAYGKQIECSLKNIISYMKRKIKKIYPLYAFTMIFTMVCEMVVPGVNHDLKTEIISLVKCLLLIQSWFPEGYFALNSVGWFMSTIMFLWVLNIPLKSALGKINLCEYSGLCYLAIIITVYLLTVWYCYSTRNTNMEYTQYVLPIGRVGEYVCGMSMGYFVASKSCVDNDKHLLLWTIFEIMAIVISAFVIYIPTSSYHFRIVQWLGPVLMLLMVFGLGNGWISELFKNRFLRYLGDISFECYLLHHIVIRVCRRAFHINPTSVVTKLEFILMSLIISVMMAGMVSWLSKRICNNEETRTVNDQTSNSAFI